MPAPKAVRGFAGIQVPIAVAGTWIALMALLAARIRRGSKERAATPDASPKDSG
jgi:hypothetical protein